MPSYLISLLTTNLFAAIFAPFSELILATVLGESVGQPPAVSALTKRVRARRSTIALTPSSSTPCVVSLSYAVTELEPLASFNTNTRAFDISESGHVAGYSNDPTWQLHATRWSVTSAPDDVHTSGWTASQAQDINDSSEMCGFATGTSQGTRAVRWSASGPPELLKPLGGDSTSKGYGINNSGDVAGVSLRTNSRAVLWPGGRGGKQNLHNQVSGASETLAFDVNDSGTVVGRGTFYSPPYTRALKWEGGTATVLTTIGGGSDSPTSISNTGYVTGGGLSPHTSKYHAELWDPQGQVTDFGLFSGASCTLTGGCPTGAWDVNTCATAVVGYSEISQSETTAVLFYSGTIYDLQTLIPANSGWTLHEAKAINDNGEIVGTGFFSPPGGGSGTRSFLLTPV